MIAAFARRLWLLKSPCTSFGGKAGSCVTYLGRPSMSQETFENVQAKPDGYEVEHNGDCVTVFSAPNYCDQMGNKGAFIRFKGADMIPEFTTFAAVSHPDVKAMAYASSMFGSSLLGV